MPISRFRRVMTALLVAWVGLEGVSSAALPTVPEGFQIRLEAGVPAVEYTCQVATAPDGALFAAEEPDPDVRREIAMAFGKLDDRFALPALIAAVRDASTPEPVREAALVSIETIETDVAIQALIELLDRGDLGDAREARVIAYLETLKEAPVKPVSGGGGGSGNGHGNRRR